MLRPLKAFHYGTRDRGPLEFKSRPRKEDGTITALMRKPVITITPNTRIRDAAETMVKHSVRRLPVTDPGSQILIGILTTRDIVDFLGGGDRHKIVKVKFGGNFFAAINEPVSEIISEDTTYGTSDMSIADVVKMLLAKGVGGAPILDKDGKIVGIVSERDFISYIPDATGTLVSYLMSRHVISAEPTLSISDAARRMISHGFRRLPVVNNGGLVGIVTSVDILRYFGTSKVFEHLRSQKMDEAMAVSIHEIMTREVLNVNPETDVGKAAKLMREWGCGGLPVVTGNKLVGIITEHDLLRLLL